MDQTEDRSCNTIIADAAWSLVQRAMGASVPSKYYAEVHVPVDSWDMELPAELELELVRTDGGVSLTIRVLGESSAQEQITLCQRLAFQINGAAFHHHGYEHDCLFSLLEVFLMELRDAPCFHHAHDGNMLMRIDQEDPDLRQQRLDAEEKERAAAVARQVREEHRLLRQQSRSQKQREKASAREAEQRMFHSSNRFALLDTDAS